MTRFIEEDYDPHKVEPVRWVWRHRIAKEGLTLLAGNESVGKSTLAAWIIARLTQGKLKGCYEGEPIQCRVVASEDSFHSGWIPKVLAMSGDPYKVKRLRREDLTVIDFKQDLQDMLEYLAERRVKFVYFDQLLDHLGGDTDSHHTKQVRDVLAPLHSSLREFGITGLGTVHPNKKRSGSFRDIISGSAAFVQIPRTAMYLGENPLDPEYKVLIGKKNNVGPTAPNEQFRLITDTVRPNGRNINTVRVGDWQSCSLSFDELLQGPTSGRTDTQRAVLVRAVRRLLSDGEWHRYEELMGDEEIAGTSPSFKTMSVVAERAGVERRRKGFGGKTEWRLSP